MHSFLETARKLIDNSDIASVVTDADGVIYLLNTASEDLLQITSVDWVQRSLFELLPELVDGSLAENLGAIRRGRVVQERALTVELQDR